MTNKLKRAHARLIKETALEQHMRLELTKRLDYGINPQHREILKAQHARVRAAQDAYNRVRAEAAAVRIGRGEDVPSACYTGQWITLPKKGRKV